MKAHPLFGLNGLVILIGWIFGRILLFALYFRCVFAHW